jgi:hypothetical protein
MSLLEPCAFRGEVSNPLFLDQNQACGQYTTPDRAQFTFRSWPIQMRTYVRFNVPWKPRYTEQQARQAIENATSWREVLEALGYPYFGKNLATIRKWAARWGISIDHLPNGRSGAQHRYTRAELTEAVAASRSWAETLRRLGYCPTGGGSVTLKKRVSEWGISTEHFDPYATSRERAVRRVPLAEVLVAESTYSRSSLKRRLFDEGLKERRCEACGQGEEWRGVRMGLILDHINGVRNDNRLENLRILCPNCAATLETHCGRKGKLGPLDPVACRRCGTAFLPKFRGQSYCSHYCGSRWDRTGVKRPGARKVERPPHLQLREEVEEHGYLGVGRRYGVSDNAIRKWLRDYEREAAIERGENPDTIQIPTRTWPNMKKAA